MTPQDLGIKIEGLNQRASKYKRLAAWGFVPIAVTGGITGLLALISMSAAPSVELLTIDVPESIQATFGTIEANSFEEAQDSAVKLAKTLGPIIGVLIIIVSGLSAIVRQSASGLLVGIVAASATFASGSIIDTILTPIDSNHSAARQFSKEVKNNDLEAIQLRLKGQGLTSTPEGSYVLAQVALASGAADARPVAHNFVSNHLLDPLSFEASGQQLYAIENAISETPRSIPANDYYQASAAKQERYATAGWWLLWTTVGLVILVSPVATAAKLLSNRVTRLKGLLNIEPAKSEVGSDIAGNVISEVSQ